MTIPKLRGPGELLVANDTVLAGGFAISHDLNQSNGLIVEFAASGDEAVNFEGRISSEDGPQIERNLALKGKAQHGQPVSIDKLLIGNRNLSRSGGKPLRTVLTLLPRDTLLVGTEPPSVSQVRFFIPNVRFGGMARTPRSGGGSKLDTVLIDTKLDGRSVQIRLQQLPDYKESIQRLGRSTSSVWTARLDVSSLEETGLKLDEAKAVADDFLLLLSFALSKRVMWVALKTMDPDITYREVCYGTTMNLKAFPGSVMGDGKLVAGNRGFTRHPLTEFLEAALPAYWGLDQDEQQAIGAAIELLCESIERFFSPAAVTLVGRAFEILCRRFLSASERAYISGASQTEKDLISALTTQLAAFAKCWGASDKASSGEWADRLNGHVSNLLRRPFKLQLRCLADRWLTKTGNTYESTWVNQFVNARNSAAHYGPIKQREFDAWVKGIALLSRVVLKILGHTGPYVDFWGEGERVSEWSTLR